MNGRFIKNRWLIFLGGLFLFLFPRLLPARTLTLGSISTEPVHEIQKLQPLAAYLAKELRSEGIDRGKVRVEKNISKMASLVKEGKIDLYLGSPFPAVAVARLTGSRFLLNGWQGGLEKHASVIFTRKETGLKRLKDLKGEMIAFESPFSTFGYFLPKMLFLQKGYKLSPKKKFSDPVGPEEIGYLFSGHDENTLLWVKKQKTAGGAVDQEIYGSEDAEAFRTIEKSISLPSWIVSYRRHLPRGLVLKIKETLKKMDQSEEGKKVLKDLGEIAKFDEIPSRALDPLIKSSEWIEAELKNLTP